MLLTDGAGNVSWGAQPVAGLPSQTSNSGKLLTTNGTSASWSNAVTVSGNNATVTGTLTVNGTNVSSIPRLSLNSPVETYNFASIGTIQSADVSLEVTSTAATGVGLGLVVRRTNGGEFARFINGAVTTRLANMSCDAAGTYFSISSAVGMYLDSTKTMFTGGNVLIGGTTDIPGTGGLKVFGTTASTTTSSGALVVSGGVGVAGAINGGGLFDFAVSANSTQVYTIQNTSTGASASTRLTLVGGTSSGSIQLYGSGHSTPNILQYASPDTHKWQCNGVDRASLSSAGALTVGSSLTTGAPTGGTAAAWKLGTVATVSPTSPNRTIEVDIGGTIYYIHAKTTNN
jgi:hypothetical protein